MGKPQTETEPDILRGTHYDKTYSHPHPPSRYLFDHCVCSGGLPQKGRSNTDSRANEYHRGREPHRHPDFPDLPTVAETLPDYEISQSWGFAVPARTPADIVSRFHAETVAAVARPQIREGMLSTGVTPMTESPQAFNAVLTAERKRLGVVISKTGIVLAD